MEYPWDIRHSISPFRAKLSGPEGGIGGGGGEAAEEGPGGSGGGGGGSRFNGRGRRSELARRGRGLGGRSGSTPAANIPASTAESMLRLLKAAAGPPISDRVLLVGAGGTTGLGKSYS